MIAASSFGVAGCPGHHVVDHFGPRAHSDDGTTSSTNNSSAPINHEKQGSSYPWRDNYNLSPGHDAVVFTYNKATNAIEMDRKVWGFVTKSGTANNPVPPGPSKHFANLMFNARSDTLFSKATFSRLLGEGRSCVVAVDGFFEWKSDPLGGGKGKKLPYFVYNNDGDSDKRGTTATTDDSNTPRKPLLMAGLWTSVATGWDHQPMLDTFTILTTEACAPLQWLHSRMPVTIQDEQLALQWLKDPTQKVHEQLDRAAHKSTDNIFKWHEVTTQMNSVRYRNKDSIQAVPKPKSVTNFFAPVIKKTDPNSNSGGGTATAASPVSTKKRSTPASSTIQSPSKKKKGTITSYFSPKSSTT